MRIMLMGDSPHTISGFGTALRNIGVQLHAKGHTVGHLGWQSIGQQMVASFHDDVLGYKVLPNIGGAQFGEGAMKYWLPRWKPDLLFVLADFWMASHVFRTELNTPFLMWYPIDGVPVTNQIQEMLKRIDYRVCMSEFGTNLTKQVGITCNTIPHGTRVDVFKPKHKDDVNDMKRKIGIPLDKFVIGRVDRNQTRKKIPRTIKAAAEFIKDHPDTVLFLWMDKRDREGYDLPYICERFGLKEGVNVFFPTPDMLANFMYGVDEEELATAMNCMDVHLWLTGGEGFGLTGLETMSCGVVNIATNYTTPPELFQFGKPKQCGLPVNVEFFEVGSAGVDRAYADIDIAVAQIKWAYENRDELKAMSKLGVQRAREVYDWKKIGKDFDSIIRNIDLNAIWR